MRLGIYVFLLLAGSAVASAEAGPEFFAEKLYPVFRQAQCNLCHNDNGVASATRFEFPPDDPSPEQIKRFGLSLAAVVNRDEPKASLLYLKPTNRAKHPGGERIQQGSPEEALLLEWVERLASLSPEAIAAGLEGAEAVEAGGHALSVRRLTHSQYNNTLEDLLGDLSRPADQFPPEDFIHGFKNQSHGQSVSPLLMEAYSAAAEKAAINAFRGGDQNGLVPCEPQGADDAACREAFVQSFGRRAFRRPLTEGELARYAALAREAAVAENDFLAGARIVVEAMLQSPNFLLRIDHGPESPWRDYDTASKLSFFLWDTLPDEDLLALAESGGLSDLEKVEAVARRMLDDPRAKPALDELLGQWMRFDRTLKTIRDRKFYPQFNESLAAAMTEETRLLFNHLVWGDGDFREFFTADYTFVNSDLAPIYELEAPENGFARVSYPADSERAGVLSHASFLTLTSKPEDTKPTERGLFVREHFLCQSVPPPPPGVNTSLPPLSDEKPMTNRERLAVHLSNEACASCHRLIDPIGLGLEHYDAIGQYRAFYHVKIPPTRDQKKRKVKTEASEYDLEIDPSGEIAGVAGSSFSSPKELGAILAEDETCQTCVVKQVFRYAVGRHETLADRDAIDATLERFRDSQFRFRELIIGIVTSRPFLEGVS